MQTDLYNRFNDLFDNALIDKILTELTGQPPKRTAHDVNLTPTIATVVPEKTLTTVATVAGIAKKNEKLDLALKKPKRASFRVQCDHHKFTMICDDKTEEEALKSTKERFFNYKHVTVVKHSTF